MCSELDANLCNGQFGHKPVVNIKLFSCEWFLNYLIIKEINDARNHVYNHNM